MAAPLKLAIGYARRPALSAAIAWLRHHLMDGKTLLLNSASIIGSTLITSGLGFVYWWVAARLLPPPAVGFAAACISAMTLVGTLSILGMGTMLVGELPRRHGNAWPLIATALIPPGVVGGILGALIAAEAGRVSTGLAPLADSLGSILVFAIGASMTAATLVLDDAFLGLLRGQLQLQRNGIMSAVKLILLLGVGLWLKSSGGMGIYLTWIVSIVASVGLLVGIAWMRTGSLPHWRPQGALLGGLWRQGLIQHLLNLALSGSALGFPVIVAAILPISYSAYFYTVWMIVNFIVGVPAALAYSLYAVGAAQPHALMRKARMTLGLSIVFAVLAYGFIFFAGGPVLSFFGSAYAIHGLAVLRWMTLAVFPLMICQHAVTIRRVRGQVGGVVPIIAIGGVLELAFAAAGTAMGGLPGMGIGWVLALALEACVLGGTVWKLVVPQGVVSGGWRRMRARVPLRSMRSLRSVWRRRQGEDAHARRTAQAEMVVYARARHPGARHQRVRAHEPHRRAHGRRVSPQPSRRALSQHQRSRQR